MILRRLTIENFRGVHTAALTFSGHTLLLGPNNVGKSTVMEALDLLLGPERLTRSGCVDEHDFYNGRYRDDVGKPVVLRLEAVLTGLGGDARRAFRDHVEWWDHQAGQLVESAAEMNEAQYEAALRVGFSAAYDPDEDEFRPLSYFCHPLIAEDEDPPPFTRADKRLCGFLYLRSLRTGSRALSLEKGTLLDIVLSLKEVQAAGMWEGLLTQLRTVGPAVDRHEELRAVLDGIEERVRQYIPLVSGGRASGFHVTNLRQMPEYRIGLSSRGHLLAPCHTGLTLILCLRHRPFKGKTRRPLASRTYER
jgi:putative ATP-dependent endonuclease of OLD family